MEEGKKLEHNAIVETYAEDMAEVLENNTEGLVKKIIQGEEEHNKEKKELSPESKKNKLFMFIGILLIILAVGILSFFLFDKGVNTVLVEKQFTPLIFTDQSTFLEVANFKKDEIAQTVSSEINTTKVKVGGVEGIYLTENKQIIGLRRFVTLIKSSFAPGDNTLFISDNFLMGAVDNPAPELAGRDFFMLIKMRGTADIFDSLRAWEPNMLNDLHGFLGVNIGSDTNYLLTKSFENSIVENKNARILYDKDSKIILMYIFADDNSVIITSSQNAADEILLRLAAGKATQ